jgi:hypothetical protein
MSKSNFIVKALTAFLRTQTEVDGLQKVFDSATPADHPVYPRSYLGPDIFDGVWICCRGHENTLVHLTGPHPFKHLKCRFCEHVICPKDSTSEILTPISSMTMEPFQGRFTAQKKAPEYPWLSREPRYCLVCRSCGLTHRGTIVSSRIEFRTAPCVCGQEPDEEGMYFFIGSGEEYRRDPQGKTVEVTLNRRFIALDRIQERNRRIDAAVIAAGRP